MLCWYERENKITMKFVMKFVEIIGVAKELSTNFEKLRDKFDSKLKKCLPSWL